MFAGVCVDADDEVKRTSQPSDFMMREMDVRMEWLLVTAYGPTPVFTCCKICMIKGRHRVPARGNTHPSTVQLESRLRQSRTGHVVK